MRKQLLFGLSLLLGLSVCACGTGGNNNNNQEEESSFSLVVPANGHTVTFDTDGGSTVNPQGVEHGGKAEKPNDPYKTGYNFVDWYYEDEVWSFIGYTVTQDMTLKAHWSPKTYIIEYKGDVYVDTYGKTRYTIEDELDLPTPSKSGYTFAGWKHGDKVITKIEKGTTGNLVLEQVWEGDFKQLMLQNPENRGILEGSGTVRAGSINTVTATPKSGYTFVGWYLSYSNGVYSDMISNKASFTFKMREMDINLYARFLNQSENQKYQSQLAIDQGKVPALQYRDSFYPDTIYITYGLYPQDTVIDTFLLSLLNDLKAGDKENNGWYLLGDKYYCKATYSEEDPASYHRYYEIGEEQWFLCKPIRWKIIEEESGYVSFISDYALDRHGFHTDDETRTIGGKTILATNYEYSDVRQWLNSYTFNGSTFKESTSQAYGFMHTAFAQNSSYLKNKTVICYDYENKNPLTQTTDKVFLPNEEDVGGYLDYHGPNAEATDYCLFQGGYDQGYLLRDTTETTVYSRYDRSSSSGGPASNRYEIICPCIYLAKTDIQGLGSSQSGGGSEETQAQRLNITFSNNLSWSSVYVFAWKEGGSSNGPFPGVKLTSFGVNAYSEKQYTIDLDASAYDHFLLSNGSNEQQTVDLKISDYMAVSGIYIGDLNTSGKYKVNSW